MKITIKYFLGILIFPLCMISSVALAFNPVTDKPVIPEKIVGSVRARGIITAVNTDSYTIEIEKGKGTISKEVKFDKNTKFQVKKEKIQNIKTDKKNITNKTKQKIAKHQRSIKPRKIAKPTSQDLKVGDVISVQGGMTASQSIMATAIHKTLDSKMNGQRINKLKVHNN